MKQIIILLPIETYDRDSDAEDFENETFDTLAEIGDKFPEGIFYTDISDFMDDCNNQEINLEHFWLTYVNLKE